MVTTQLAATCLAWAAAFDNRKTDSPADRQLQIQAWAEALHDLTTPEDARRAITEHYAESTEWLKPAHVNRLTARYRKERAAIEDRERDRRAIETQKSRAVPPPPEFLALRDKLFKKDKTS